MLKLCRIKSEFSSMGIRSVYLSGQLASREFPSQIHISASQINFFGSHMNFSASDAFFFLSIVVLCFDNAFLDNDFIS